MKVQQVSIQEFVASLKQSVEMGQKHYPVLFAGTLFSGMSSFMMGPFFSGVFAFIWIPGMILVAQTMVHQREPILSQFFLAFTNTSVLKKIFPYALMMLVVAALGFVLTHSVSRFFLTAENNLSGNILILSVLGMILILPLMYVPFLLLLGDLPWTKALEKAIEGTWQNKLGSLLLYLPSFLTFGIFTLPISYDLLTIEFSFLPLLLMALLMPFLACWIYLIYKKMFAAPEADFNIDMFT